MCKLTVLKRKVDQKEKSLKKLKKKNQCKLSLCLINFRQQLIKLFQIHVQKAFKMEINKCRFAEYRAKD